MKKNNNLQKQLGLMERLIEGARFPILLPKNDRINYLILDQSHKPILHSGAPQALSQVRRKYWILQGRETVKTILRNCIIWRNYERCNAILTKDSGDRSVSFLKNGNWLYGTYVQ